MSSEFVNKVSDTAGVLLSEVSDIATSVGHKMTSVADSVSSSVGGVVHDVSFGVQRLITYPPCETEDKSHFSSELESASVYATPNVTGSLSPLSDSPVFESESLKEVAHSVDFELGISEDYYKEPENLELNSYASVEELEKAIDKCKELVNSSEGGSERRRILVHRLIQLRICLEKAKDESEISSMGIQVIEGHQLHPKVSPIKQASTQYCDKCSQVIWRVFSTLYKCILCEYQCHGKCVKKIRRKCASLRFSDHPNYIFKICPEIGLSEQDFRCTECFSLITNKNGWREPRLCDYSGRYFCPACHWYCRGVSPARVVHNWDFEERPMSQVSKQSLFFMRRKPLLNLEDLNPHLFIFVEDLSHLKKLRQDIICMKAYLTSCRSAQESRLLRMLEDRQHFVDDAHLYSMADLLDLHEGILMPSIIKIHECFSSHIKESCLVCKGKGFICEMCDDASPIFPFDDSVSICLSCQATFHEKCFLKEQSRCPRCFRHQNRKLRCQVLPD